MELKTEIWETLAAEVKRFCSSNCTVNYLKDKWRKNLYRCQKENCNKKSSRVEIVWDQWCWDSSAKWTERTNQKHYRWSLCTRFKWWDRYWGWNPDVIEGCNNGDNVKLPANENSHDANSTAADCFTPTDLSGHVEAILLAPAFDKSDHAAGSQDPHWNDHMITHQLFLI